MGAAFTTEPLWWAPKAPFIARTILPTGGSTGRFTDVGVEKHPSRAAMASARLYCKRDHVWLSVPSWGAVNFEEDPYRFHGTSTLQQASNDRLLVIVDRHSPAERTWLAGLLRYLDQHHTVCKKVDF